MVTHGCGEGEDLFIEAICDGHSSRPLESICELLLGLQDKTINHLLQYFFKKEEIRI